MRVYAKTYYTNGTVGPGVGVGHRMCPVGTPRGTNSVGCLPGCKAEMPNVTYMGRPGDWSVEYNNDVFVFDTYEGRFGIATGTSLNDPGLILQGCGAFPINTNLPQVNVRGDVLFAVGGECDAVVVDGETYGHYPPLALSGKITLA